MSSANPSQSTTSDHGTWFRPQSSTGRKFFSNRQSRGANSWTRESFGKVAMMLFAIVGLIVSSYLAWVSLTSSKLAGCGAGQVFDCGHVMATKWSTVFGIPVSVPALLVYLSLLTSIAISWNAKSAAVRSVATQFIAVTAMTAAFAAVWFITLQLFVVEHLCAYCLAAHACSLIIAGLMLWTQPVTRPQLRNASFVGLIAVGILATLQANSPAPKTYEIQTFETTTASVSMTQNAGDIFEAPGSGGFLFEAPVSESPESESSRIDSQNNGKSANSVFEAPIDSPVERQTSAIFNLGDDVAAITAALVNPNLFMAAMLVPIQQAQANDKQKPKNEQPVQRRLVNLNGGQIQLDVAQWPICGKQTAKTIGIEMFDYTCPHCRKTHHALKTAMQQSNGEFAFVSLAVPMNSQCNPAVKSTNAHHVTACDLANLSVAVWRIDPTKYSEYHDWLFTGEHAPLVASAKAKAESLVGAERLQKELASGAPQQYIAKHCQLYQAVGQGVIPKMYIGNNVVSGQIQTADTLIKLINNQR